MITSNNDDNKINCFITKTLFYNLYDNLKFNDTCVCSFHTSNETTLKSNIDLYSDCQSSMLFDEQVNTNSKYL